jgi:hypothetical protein
MKSLKDSLEWSFEKLKNNSTTFSKLTIAFLNSSRSIAQICDQVIVFEDFDERVLRCLSVIDEFLFLIIFETKLLMSTNIKSSNLWFVRKKSRIWKLIFSIWLMIFSFINSWFDHLQSKTKMNKIVILISFKKRMKERSSLDVERWKSRWRREKKMKRKDERAMSFVESIESWTRHVKWTRRN